MNRVAKYDRESGRLMAVYPSIKAAADAIYNAASSHICACCKGRMKTAYGYVWKYYNRPEEDKDK